MNLDSNPAKGIFLAAIKVNGPDDRAALLDRECGGDSQLRNRVEQLLRAHENPDSGLVKPFVALPVTSPARDISTANSAPTDGDGGNRSMGVPDDADVRAVLAPAREPGSVGRLDHYEILEVIGRGGMGIVLKARDTKLQRIVAIKLLAPPLAASSTARRRFIREAQAAAAIRDEHVVSIHAVEDAGPVPYLVMEFVAGITLDDLVRHGAPIDVAEVLRIGIQCARGLAAAHAQGLIHRDVKPANVLLENGVQRVKLTDFGLARAADDASITQSGVIAGTPLYMSPEQARAEKVDHRSDLFGLGSVLYTLAAGRPAFQASGMAAVMHKVCEDAPPSIKQLNAAIPDWLSAAIAKLMAKNPSDRFQSAAEVADLLSEYLAFVQQPHPTRPPSAIALFNSAQKRQRRFRWAATLGAAVIIAAVVAMIVFRRPAGDAGLPPATPNTIAADAAQRHHPPTAIELERMSSPFDGRKRADIPTDLLALAGNGDPTAALSELVAVLTTPPFGMPGRGPTSWPAIDRAGKFLAIPCGGDVAVFDAVTGTVRRVLAGQADRIYCVAFSPDGKRLAAGTWGPDYSIRIWEVDTGKLTLNLVGHAKRVNRVAFNSDGNRLASVASDESLRVWNTGTGDLIYRSGGAPGNLYDVAFSPNDAWLASTGTDGFLWVWDATNGKKIKRVPCHAPAKEEQHSVAFSPDGKLVASGSETQVHILDATTWAEKCVIPSPGVWVAFSPDSQTLFAAATVAAAGQPNVVTRWDADTGKTLGGITLQSRGKWATFLLGPDGSILYSMRCDPADPTLRCYDTKTGAPVTPPSVQPARVFAVAFSPDGHLLATGNDDGTVRLWDLAGWRPGEPAPPSRVLGRHADRIWDVAFNSDGTLLATGSYDGTLGLWDVVAGRRVRTLRGHQPFGSMVAFSPDGRTLAVGRTDGTVRLWDVATGKEAEPIAGHAGHVIAVAYSPDGRFIASAGYRDRMVIVRDAKFNKPIPAFDFGEHEMGCLAFSPDSKTLAAGGSEGRIQLWDVESRQETLLTGQKGLIEGMAFHPTGRLLATGSDDGTVRFWDLASPDHVRVIGPGPFGKIARRLAFSPDGRYLATANLSGTVTILRTPQ